MPDKLDEIQARLAKATSHDVAKKLCPCGHERDVHDLGYNTCAYCADSIADDLTYLLARLKAAEAVCESIRNVEWSAYDEMGSGEEASNLCPECGAYKGKGHQDDCVLGESLTTWQAARG